MTRKHGEVVFNLWKQTKQIVAFWTVFGVMFVVSLLEVWKWSEKPEDMHFCSDVSGSSNRRLQGCFCCFHCQKYFRLVFLGFKSCQSCQKWRDKRTKASHIVDRWMNCVSGKNTQAILRAHFDSVVSKCHVRFCQTMVDSFLGRLGLLEEFALSWSFCAEVGPPSCFSAAFRSGIILSHRCSTRRETDWILTGQWDDIWPRNFQRRDEPLEVSEAMWCHAAGFTMLLLHFELGWHWRVKGTPHFSASGVFFLLNNARILSPAWRHGVQRNRAWALLRHESHKRSLWLFLDPVQPWPWTTNLKLQTKKQITFLKFTANHAGTTTYHSSNFGRNTIKRWSLLK